MAKNVQHVLNDWRNFQKNNDYDSINTDGNTVNSFKTPVLVRAADGSITLNTKKYSLTTTKQQNTILNWLFNNGYKIIARHADSKIFIKG